jgi:hypothetical protein
MKAMTKSSNPLPEKCCAKCGFLYGLARAPASREDAIFDPDLIRSKEYPPTFDRSPGIITSQPYVIQEYTYGNGGVQPDHPQIRQLCWGDTVFICCYLKNFTPISIKRQSLSGTFDQIRDQLRLTIKPDWPQVNSVIRTNRQNCNGFFEYHPGYTPAQHIELRLEEQRIQRAEAHEAMLVKWSAELERWLAKSAQDYEDRWRNIQVDREDERSRREERWRKKERELMIFFSVLGLIYTILGWIVSILTARFFPGN